MSIQLPHDPRTALVRTKYFSLHPKPLERWLWRQGLPQAAERVFWLHWEEGMRSGDWSSEIPIKRVARECAIDPSTVTRAYQLLKSLGLVKRENPGRDPSNPFCQATAITEVRLPREFLTELARSPNRPIKDIGATESAAVQPPARAAVVRPDAPAAYSEKSRVAPAISRGSRPSRQETQALFGRASEGERARFFTASRDRLTTLEFDADTRLTPEDRGQILAQLAQLAAAKPAPTAPATSATKGSFVGPRRLNVLDLARTRKRIFETVPAAIAP